MLSNLYFSYFLYCGMQYIKPGLHEPTQPLLNFDPESDPEYQNP
jgi:hypothetical protein